MLHASEPMTVHINLIVRMQSVLDAITAPRR